MGKHIHIDANGILWEITKEELPKKRGVYRYWIAETVDKKQTIKGDDGLRGMYKHLKEKFGSYKK